MQTFLAPTFQCDWCKLGSLCNGIVCVNFFHRFLEHTKRMITKYSCLDIGNASKRELQATSLCRLSWLPPFNVTGVSWDPYVMALYVSIFFIGSSSIQKG